MRITVFTPTYNRAYIIEQLYRSLQRQTFRDFEWVVVDAGSTDNTPELFRGWMQEENPFPIRYFQMENGGKCRAINRGLDHARGTLFFNVDSDDYLLPDALEKIDAWERTLPRDGRFCGVVGNLGTAPGVTRNYRFEGDWYDGSAFDRYEKMTGERAIAFYTEVHRRYRYPEYPGERFMTEAVTWNRMANDGYRLRFFNDIIWIFQYQPDGLTSAGQRLFLENPRGYGLWLREKARFRGESRRKLWYTFTCDLSHLYTSRQIASFIGAPYPVIAAINTAHKAVHALRKRRNP